MNRALVTQMLEAVDLGKRYAKNLMLNQTKFDAAITAAREYLATEPSSERAALIKRLRSETWSGFQAMAEQAADMLESDVQQAKRVPMTMTERSAAWVAATIEMPSQENCYLRGMIDAESHHGITQADKPTDWSAA